MGEWFLGFWDFGLGTQSQPAQGFLAYTLFLAACGPKLTCQVPKAQVPKAHHQVVGTALPPTGSFFDEHAMVEGGG